MRHRLSCLLLAVALASGVAAEPAHGSDEKELLAIHATVLRAHRERDLAAWMATQSERFVVVNRGEISHPTRAEQEAFLGPYLNRTRFREYKDLVPPIVKVSRDGSLAWLIAQIHAAGAQTDASGKEIPIEFTSAWIELYEKQAGRWVSVGNVSNFKQ
jgi:hypothetical protein